MSATSVSLIAAVSPERVIGKNGTIPWHYSGDLWRFKRLTLNTTVIMGRATWESLWGKPLPNRRNIVITSHPIEGMKTFSSIPKALDASEGEVWFIGGAKIYEEAMRYCDLLDITYVPDHVDPEGAVLFPPIDPGMWNEGPLVTHEDEPFLTRQTFTNRCRS
jgi:dihydrofolate reductase